MNWDNINEIDRQMTLALNGSDSIFLDNLMMTITNTFAWSLVMITLIVIFVRNNDIRETLILLAAIAVMMIVADRLCSGLVKPLVARWRPTQDPQIMHLVDVVNGYRGGRFGFFSGHACNTFTMAMFLSRLFHSRRTTIVLFLWALTTTFTRLYLGVHYLGDVTVGTIAGLIIGSTFYALYHFIMTKVRSSRLTSNQFTKTGYKKDDMNILLFVIFLNYILVLIFAIIRGV